MSPDVELCNIYTSPMFVAAISGAMALAGVLLNQLSHQWGEMKRHKRDINLRFVESEIRKQENIQDLQLQKLTHPNFPCHAIELIFLQLIHN